MTALTNSWTLSSHYRRGNTRANIGAIRAYPFMGNSSPFTCGVNGVGPPFTFANSFADVYRAFSAALRSQHGQLARRSDGVRPTESELQHICPENQTPTRANGFRLP